MVRIQPHVCLKLAKTPDFRMINRAFLLSGEVHFPTCSPRCQYTRHHVVNRFSDVSTSTDFFNQLQKLPTFPPMSVLQHHDCNPKSWTSDDASRMLYTTPFTACFVHCSGFSLNSATVQAHPTTSINHYSPRRPVHLWLVISLKASTMDNYAAGYIAGGRHEDDEPVQYYDRQYNVCDSSIALIN